MHNVWQRCGWLWLCASLLFACGTPPTPPVPIAESPPTPTAAVATAVPTRIPPTPVATVAPNPTRAMATAQPPNNKPENDIFAGMSVEQKACLQTEWGDGAFADITSFARAPSTTEQAAFVTCNITMGGAPPAQEPAGGHTARKRPNARVVLSDGVKWSEGVLVAESASVPEVIYTSKGEYWAYWVDFSVATSINTEQIGVAYSTDGKNWQKRGMATFAGGEGMTPVDPDAFELPDGRLRMYFYDIADRSSHKIYSAVSSDGVNFVLEPGIRFQADAIYDPNVVLLPDGRYRMYLNHTDIWSATSSDGLTFVKDDGVRVEKGAVPGALVLPNGRVRLYVCNQGISVFESADGLTFERIAQSVIQGKGIICDPSVAATPDGYILMYKFAEMTNPPKSPPSP